MTRTNLLATGAIVALVFATGPSMAQQEGGAPLPAEKTGPSGAKQPSSVRHQSDDGQNTPAGRNERLDGRTGEAPHDRGRHETTGQAPREDQPNRPNERISGPKRGDTEQAPRSGQPPATGQAPRQDRPMEDNRATGQAPREDGKGRASEQNRLEQERGKSDREENRGTVGQDAAGTRANVNVTPDKRARIHETIIHERNAPRVTSVNFKISVGTRIAAHGVPLAALPQTIVEIEPAWRDFEYFVIGQEIVIVDPGSLEIVAIVDA
jgi:hypothetical protein